jgi:hypothetical protein
MRTPFPWLATFAALLVGCPPGGSGSGGPIPAGQGATILDPTISLTLGPVTLYCDGTFDGAIVATATYPAPPPAPAKSALGKTLVTGAQVGATTNMQPPTVGGFPLTFTANGAQSFGVSGRLTSPCAVGTVQLTANVTYEGGGGRGAAGGPFTIGPVPISGHGPTPDPTAKAPNGAFSFEDTLHCCAAGNVTLAAVAGANVNPGATANPNTIACAPGPTADESVTLAGQLTVPENNGSVRLNATAGASTCIVKTTVDHP